MRAREVARKAKSKHLQDIEKAKAILSRKELYIVP